MNLETKQSKHTMVRVDGKLFLTVLIVALVVVYLVKSSPPQEPVPRKRRRTNATAAAKPPTTSPFANLLACVKWETISNMLHWRSEMSNLDGLLEDLQQQEKTPPSASPI